MSGRRDARGFQGLHTAGHVIDLAVAVAIGAAFGLVVSSFTTNLLTPLLAARRKTEPDVVSPARDCPYCLSSILMSGPRSWAVLSRS
ncbi:MAG: MscL family protein, partial [Actinomycetota bacterium]|nr:MscL family protein [Actinomycetota bacterium]